MAVKYKIQKEFKEGRGYTKEDWDAVDAPPATDEQLAQARPFKEVFPDLAVKMEEERAKRGRPKKDKTKTLITVRLDPDVVERYRAKGKGWQSKMNKDLRKAVGL